MALPLISRVLFLHQPPWESKNQAFSELFTALKIQDALNSEQALKKQSLLGTLQPFRIEVQGKVKTGLDDPLPGGAEDRQEDVNVQTDIHRQVTSGHFTSVLQSSTLHKVLSSHFTLTQLQQPQAQDMHTSEESLNVSRFALQPILTILACQPPALL